MKKNGRGPTVFDEAGVAHLRFLARNNLTAPEIAEALGTTTQSIHTVCSRYRIQIGDDNALLVTLPPKIMARIRDEARRRGMARHDLLRRLAIAIATDDLFRAVLPGPGRPPNEERVRR
jgi:hypothetical protein